MPAVNRAVVELTILGSILCACWFVFWLSKKRATKPDGGYRSRREFDVDLETLKRTVVHWTTTTNHREIGILYILFGTFAALWGGTDAMMMRTELLTPNADIWSTETYNALFTSHGITMLFFFVTPVFFGIGNYFVPLLIDADDMAFPRLNAIGFWLLPPSLFLARGGLPAQVVGQFLNLLNIRGDLFQFFWTLREPELGWTLYTPLSIQSPNPQVNFLILGLHLSGIATTLGAINFIVTIAYERGENVGWENLDIFVWNILTTSGLILFAFPLLGSALIMLLLDRNFGTTFFIPEGGDPILWQHLFWFFGHPEVYIIFLPAAGLMSFILPKFAGRKLFGFTFVVYSTLAIGILSFGVWAHHMFTTGIDPRIRASFMAVSIAIAVPSAIKVFNWITTIWSGNVRLTAPMVLCISSIGTFVVGGVTGVFLATIPVDILYHGTYYVVGHFHFIVMGIIPFMMIAASYYWYPILTGRLYDRQLALFQSILLVFGSVLTFGSLILMGLLTLPRRLAFYPPEFASFQRIATVGAFLIGLSVLLWLYNMLWSFWSGTPVQTADVWGLKRTQQFTREWQWFERRLEEKYGIEPTEPETTRPSSTTVPGEGSPTVLRTVEPLLSTIPRVALAAGTGGLVGTMLMSGVLFTATILGVFDLASFSELAGLVGLRGAAVGYLLFLAGGMTTWALLFAVFAEYLPGRPRIITGLAYATIISVGFALAFYTGQTDLQLLAYVVFVLIAHWFYGFGLAVTFEYLTSRWQVKG
ncbi:cytochrome c oxidase subunit 1 [Haladaptatus litoreus]|uniref:Cytochrome c oxidase subunit 1 n=1 Tax=Haladaptatus litoreus TaxID=553468 RepID=A0A1N6X5A8_9EURY|nr:cytochrome c oxidase subunit 1 [Haladaptatus litoreus]